MRTSSRKPVLQVFLLLSRKDEFIEHSEGALRSTAMDTSPGGGTPTWTSFTVTLPSRLQAYPQHHDAVTARFLRSGLLQDAQTRILLSDLEVRWEEVAPPGGVPGE